MEDEELKKLRFSARMERLELTRRQIEAGVYSIAEAETDRVVFRRAFLENHPPTKKKLYISADEATIAYEYILENNCTADESLQYVAKLLGKGCEWVKGVKHTRYIHPRKVVKRHDTHPQQEAMVKSKVFDRKRLTTANTISKQLSSLSRMCFVQRTIEQLKGRNAELEGLLLKTSSEKVLTKREVCLNLLLSGKKNSEIAEQLGISERTVRRWVNGNTA